MWNNATATILRHITNGFRLHQSAKFSKLMNEKLQNGDVQARKAYLRSVISVIEVDDKIVRIFGDKTQLAAALSEQNERTGKVRGFVRKWCRLGDSNT